MEQLKRTLSEDFNVSVTENGAAGYRTTGRDLLDLHFAVSSLRNRSVQDVADRFAKAYFADKPLAILWLFYAGDVRGGLGERRLFRIGMRFIAHTDPAIARKLLPLIPEYSRWDSVTALLDSQLADDAYRLIAEQLQEDKQNTAAGKPVSLCAKWLPSINATNEQTKRLAGILREKLGVSAKVYRQTLSGLRAHLRVTEVQMSARQWEEIDYARVPSRANLLYRKAFLRHDEARRTDYLEKLQSGKTKINGGVLFPHDIVHAYAEKSRVCRGAGAPDETLEQLWKALPDYVQGNETTICVADGSGSMTYCPVGRTNVRPIEVANALAIYFAERCRGPFADSYITFSAHPQLVDFSHCATLHDKIGVALSHCEVANTNIEAVFDLLLTTAVNAKMKQADMPQNVLILSDMEFDSCAECNEDRHVSPRLFQQIDARYRAHGYRLPRLVFWNICSRTETIPVKENEAGVALVSGFSPAIAKMVLHNSTDPFECLLGELRSKRYTPVIEALEN